MEILAIDDTLGVVASETQRLRRCHDKRQSELSSDPLESWDELKVIDQIEECAHHLFATKYFRPLLLESNSLACWNSLVEFSRREESLNSGPIQTTESQRLIGLKIGADETTIGRWERFVTVPDGDKVLGAVLIALELEIDDVEFADRKDLLCEAVLRTIGFIRDRAIHRRPKKKPDHLPTVEEVSAVREMIRHSNADLFFQTGSDRKLRAGAIADVCDRLEGRFPGHAICCPRTLEQAFHDWGESYAIFRLSLVCGWPNGTEDEFNWSTIDEDEFE